MSAVSKAKELVETKLAKIVELEGANTDRVAADDRYRQHYEASLAAGWGKSELKGLGFEEPAAAARSRGRKGGGSRSRQAPRPSSEPTPEPTNVQDDHHSDSQPSDEHHPEFGVAAGA